MQTASVVLGHRYQLGKQIGAGGMGAVYHAIDRLTGEQVALKRVTIEAGQLAFNSRTESDNFRVAIAHEFQTLASLRHPNIISVMDYGFDDYQQPYFTMMLLEESDTIRDVAYRCDDEGKVRLLVQMLQALAYLHRRGIIHRDLKPGNVLVTPDQQVRVLDFGLALDNSQAKEISGTLAYMAPEILQGQGVSRYSDLYAVGVMAYEIFAGSHPFNTSNLSELVQNVLATEPDLTRLPQHLDLPELRSGAPSLQNIVGRLLSKSPYDRYPSSESVIRDLSAALGASVSVQTVAIRESYLQAARFVGRDAELQTLISALQETMNGQGSRWLVAGESGVGKSRIMEELRVRALVQGALVLRGQEVSESTLAYQLWRDPVRRLVLSTVLDDLEASILKELVPDIGSILGRFIPDAPRLGGSDYRQRLALTIADLFRRQKYPLLLILEDLHWSADDSLEPLRQLNRVAPDVALLVVASYRHDERDVAALLPNMNRMTLARLGEGDIAELTRSMLGESGALPQVVELLQRETEGNIFFLVEFVRTLAEEAGGLTNVGAMTLPQHVYSGGVAQIVQRRLDQVPAEYIPMLKLAAVVGRQIDLNILSQLNEQNPPEERVNLEDWLTACANVAIFSNWEGAWRFAHDKLREGLLDRLDPAERAMLSRKIAEALAIAYPDDTSRASMLADLWRDAGDMMREALYAHIAGDYALKVGNFQEARDLLLRALRGFSRQQHGVEEMQITKLLGDTYESMADYHEAVARYKQSMALARERSDYDGIVAALDGMGRIAQQRGDFDTAQSCYDHALKITRETGNRSQLADALNGQGTVATQQGQLDKAERHYNESLGLRREIEDSRGIAACLNNLGIVARYKGDLQAARDYYTQSLAIRRSIGDRRAVASSLNNLGIIARSAGEFAEARTHYEQADAIFREIGDPRGIASNLNNLGVVAFERADYPTATHHYSESLSTSREIGDQRGIAYALYNLGRVNVAQNLFEESLPLFKESMHITQSIGDPRGTANTLSELGMALRGLGRFDEAQHSMREALNLYNEVGDRRGQMTCLLYLGTIMIQLRQIDEANGHLQDGIRLALELDSHQDAIQFLARFLVLRVRQSDWKTSAQILGYMGRQTITNPDVMQMVRSARAHLDLSLPAEQFSSLQTTGQTLSLRQVMDLIAGQVQ